MPDRGYISARHVAGGTGGPVTSDYINGGRSLYVGVQGHIGLENPSGEDIYITNVPQGTWLDIPHHKIYANNHGQYPTTAEDIVSFR